METREVDLSGASLEQLENLKRQTEAEVKHLSSNLSALRIAQSRFGDATSALTSLPEDGAGREILVPLTSSLYVPGKISSTNEVLVDVGTGFYVGKPSRDAAEIMSKKTEMVKKQVEQLGKIISIKQSNLEIIEQHIQLRQQMQSGGEGESS